VVAKTVNTDYRPRRRSWFTVTRTTADMLVGGVIGPAERAGGVAAGPCGCPKWCSGG
jgi:hypothetical protein